MDPYVKFDSEKGHVLVLANEELYDGHPRTFDKKSKKERGGEGCKARLKIFETRGSYLTELNCGSLFDCAIRKGGQYHEGRLLKDRKGRWYTTIVTISKGKNSDPCPTIHCYCLNREKSRRQDAEGKLRVKFWKIEKIM